MRDENGKYVGTVEEWVRFAETDLSSAKTLFEVHRPIPIEIVGFHSQQAAEKIIKAFLVSKDIIPEKTHELHKLIKKCLKFNSEFKKFALESDTLTQYAVPPRYPHELELEEYDAETAIKYADRIMEFVKELLDPPTD